MLHTAAIFILRSNVENQRPLIASRAALSRCRRASRPIQNPQVLPEIEQRAVDSSARILEMLTRLEASRDDKYARVLTRND